MKNVRPGMSVVSVAALALVAGLVTPVSAHASDVGTETGGDVSASTETQPTDDDDQAKWRATLDSAYVSYLTSGAAGAKDYLNKVLNTYTGKGYTWPYSGSRFLTTNSCPLSSTTGGGTTVAAATSPAKATRAASVSTPGAGSTTDDGPLDPGGVDDETPVPDPSPSTPASRGDGTTSSEPTTDFTARLGTSANSCSSPPPTKKVLALTSYGQKKGYYCGPAAGYDILKYLGETRGRYAGARWNLSQGSLAKSAYMDTDRNKRTAWADDRFRIGLNRWIYGKNTGWYVSVHAPSYATFRQGLVADVVHGHPFGANAVEFAGGKHYNGHPNRTIGHWLTAYGYEKNGATVYFADPSFTVFGNAKAKFTASSKFFTETFLQSNGITY